MTILSSYDVLFTTYNNIAHNEICAKLEIKFNFCILIN